MKVGPVVARTRVLPALAVFLLLPIDWTRATDWGDELVLGGQGDAAGSAVLSEEDTGVEPFAAGMQQAPFESQPLGESSAGDAGLPTAFDGSVTSGYPAACTSEGPWGEGFPAQPCGPHCPPCHAHACWSFRADALLLWRNAPASRPIYSRVEDGELVGTALNANELNSDVLVAPRLSLLRTDCDGRTLEATYFYAGNFYSDRTLPYSPDGYATSPPGIYGNDWGPPDTSLDSATAKLLGQLQSLEFNARHCIWPETCQFLIGFRWLQWNETLQMKDFFTYTEPEAVSGKDLYETRCFNNLWGGQIGLDTLLVGRPGMTRVEGLVKAGAYYNNAGQASNFRYVQSDGYEFANQARAGGPAACSFVGEVGLTAVVPISCNCDFRCGYFGLWLTNLAQPTRQLSKQTINQFDSVAGLDTAGSLILQGLSLGLEGRW